MYCPQRSRPAALAVSLLIACLARALPAFAAEPGGAERNIVELQAEAQREVANDLLYAVLYVELNDADAARLAAQLNRVTGDALKAAGDFKTVRTRSGTTSTYPLYDRNQKPGGWRGRSEIRLESRDFEAAARLIGRLQSSMQLLSVSFGVSRQYKVDTENEIIGEALQAFRARAEIVRRALGGQGYVLQRMQIATGSSAPPPRPLARAMAAGAAAEMAPPQFEGGMSTITVNVSGTIRVE